MSHIRLESIYKRFGEQTVLYNVNLCVNQGELVALVGPSGSGKTTTLKLIAALLDPSEGTIRFDDVPVNALATRERGAVVVFQDYSLFPHLSVLDNIGFGLKMRGIHKKERLEKSMELLSLVQLEGHGGKFPTELSGGQQQRVAIARALAVEPKVLLLDEPFSNLDAGLKGTMRDFVRRLQKRLGITCIFVTHDTQDALMTADRIAVLFDGEIEQFDTPQGIYQNPANKRVADFFGAAAYERVKVSKKGVFSRFGEFTAAVSHEGEAELMLRPEAIRIASGNQSGVKGTITEAVFSGERIHYTVRVSDCEYRVLDDAKQLRHVGDEVPLVLDLHGICLFAVSNGVRL